MLSREGQSVALVVWRQEGHLGGGVVADAHRLERPVGGGVQGYVALCPGTYSQSQGNAT